MISRNNTIYVDVIAPYNAERKSIDSYDSIALKDEIYDRINDASLFPSDTLYLSCLSFIVSKIAN